MSHHKFKIERISDEFDPDRCNATRKAFGQCMLKIVPGSKYCPIHGGDRTHQENVRKNIFSYRLARYQTRLNELTESNTIKSLRDEIAILKFLVQTHLDFVESEGSFGQYSTILSRLISEVQQLAESCAKVELSLDTILDKKDAIEIAQDLIFKLALITQVPDDLYDDIMTLLDQLHLQESSSHASNYQLKHWKDKIAEYITSDRIVSLRGEIGVIRLIIEDKLNTIKTPYDLTLQAVPLLESIKTVGKLVSSCHRLESSMGLLLDETQAKDFGQKLIEIVARHIPDEQVLTKLCNLKI